MPASCTLAAGPFRPGTAAALAAASNAFPQATGLRSLPDDIKHEVLDELGSKDQTNLIVADRDSWKLSGKYPALSADSRHKRYLETHIPTLLEGVENRIAALRNLSSGGCMHGILTGFGPQVMGDLQQIELLLQTPPVATAQYPVEIMAHERLAQRMQLDNLRWTLHSLQMHASSRNISLLFRF